MKDEDIKVPVDAPKNRDEFNTAMRKAYPDITPEQLATTFGTHVNKTLTQSVVDVMGEYSKVLIEDMKKSFDEEVKRVSAEQREALVKGIREGLGISENPTVHVNDLDSIVRKIVLEVADPGKRSRVGKVDKPGGKPGAEDEEDDEEEDEDGKPKPKMFNFAKRFALETGGAVA